MKIFIILSLLLFSGSVLAGRSTKRGKVIIKNPSPKCKKFVRKIKAGKTLRSYNIKITRIGGGVKLTVNKKLNSIQKVKLAKAIKVNDCGWSWDLDCDDTAICN